MTQERAAQSGAAASSAALASAIRGITLLLCATLSDRDTPPGSAAVQSRRREPQSASNSAEALSALEALAVRGTAESGQPVPAEKPAGSAAQAAGTLGRYEVTRDTAWVDSTLQRLAPLLERVLPPLCSHPHPAVREALAKGETSAYVCKTASHINREILQYGKERCTMYSDDVTAELLIVLCSMEASVPSCTNDSLESIGSSDSCC